MTGWGMDSDLNSEPISRRPRGRQERREMRQETIGNLFFSAVSATLREEQFPAQAKGRWQQNFSKR